MKKWITLLGFIPIVTLFAQQPFTAGSIVVIRVGVPDNELPAGTAPVFLEEFSASGKHLQTIPIPASGDNKLTLGGRSITEGVLKRSANGALLTFGGYELTSGVSNPSSNTTNANRRVAMVNANAQIDFSNRLPMDSLYPNASFRAVVTRDGSKFWTAGGNQGVRGFRYGSDSTFVISNTVTNLRGIDIQFGQLFINHGSGVVNTRIMQVGNGVPEISEVTATPLPGLPTSGSAGCDFFFADLNPAIEGPDVLYFADDLSGLRKYSLVSGTWVLNSITGSGADLYRGLTGIQVFGGAILYTVFRAGNQAVGGGQLGLLVDLSGYNAPMSAVPQVLAVAAPNTGFRGIALAPTLANPKTESYVFVGNGLWSDTLNWAENKMPPDQLTNGSSILIYPQTGGNCKLDKGQTIEKGGIFLVKPGTQFITMGNLEIK